MAAQKAFRNNKRDVAKPIANDTTARVFKTNVDYDIVLKTFRDEFNKRFTINFTSPETGLDGFEELAVLGAGSFGQVKLVKEQDTGKYYAVKLMLKDKIVRMKQVAHIYNEKRVLNSIRFPALISLEFSRKDNDYIFLGLPFINGGELFKYHRSMRKFNEKQARFYGSQVFLGLEYMHNLCLLYRDLKPENIMIDGRGYIKITDFGFAKRVETRTMTLCGTPEYLAPEIIQSKPYGTSVDWWSFGILIYELVAGFSPFSPHNRDVMTMYAKICDGDYDMPSYFSSSLKDLVGHLLQVDMALRFGNMTKGNKEIKFHDWFKQVDWYGILNQVVPPPFVPYIKDIEDLSNFDKYPNIKRFVQSKTNRHADIFKDF